MVVNWEQELELLRYLDMKHQTPNGDNLESNFDFTLVDVLWMASKIMTIQKKKDLKDQYQVANLKEYDVMHTCITAYPHKEGSDRRTVE